MKGILTQGPPPVPELGSKVRTAGEGGRASLGAQAQPLCKITSLLLPSRFTGLEHLGCSGERRRKRREVALGTTPPKGTHL